MLLKKLVGTLVLLTALSGCNLANIVKMRAANDDLQPNWPAGTTEIVLPTHYDGEKPYVFVSLNGVDGFKFLIDSGASMTYVFDTPLGKQLDLEKGYTLSIGGWGDEEDSEIYQTKVDSMGLGKVTFESVNLAYLPVSKSKYFARPDQATFDGVLGHDILRHFSWIFDKDNNRVSISSAPYPTDGTENTLEFDTFFSKISVMANIDFGNGQTTEQELIIDTGSRNYVKVSASYVANHFELTLPTVTAADFGLSGKTEHERVTVPRVTLGDQDFMKVKTNLIGPEDDEDDNWIVGSALLNQYVTVLDYHTSKLHFLRDDTVKFRSKYNLMGLALRKLRSGEFIVRYVFPQLPAAQVDIEEGDLVTSINGQSSSDMSLEDFLTLSDVEGKYDLCLTRDDKPSCVVINTKQIAGYSD